MKSLITRHGSLFEREELRELSRSMAELQWLLLLVLLYDFIPIHPLTDRNALLVTMVCCPVSILVFRCLRFFARETRRKLAVETWLMIIFISLALWHTGMKESPLLNLYLLLADTGAADARVTAGRIHSAARKACIDCQGERIRTTAIGIACVPEGTGQAEVIHDLADQAQYNSKRSGCNRISDYDSEPVTAFATA